jgi:hypothetical protein
MMSRRELAAWIVALFLTLAIFAGAVWWMLRIDVPPSMTEWPVDEVRQDDGSLVIERTATTPTARPKQHVPAGAKVERIVQVIVQPDAVPAAGQPRPPVTVDLSLVRESDGGRRVLASSPDGVVVGGLDVPVEPIILPEPEKRWAAGLSYSPIANTSGVWIERDVWRVRVGLDVHQAANGIDARVRVGVVF